MASVKFNDDEKAIFFDENISPYAKVLYFCLRDRMDFKTGVVGMPPHRLNYKYLAWNIDYVPPSGSKEPCRAHKRDAIRNLLKVLQKHGFVDPVVGADGKALSLVFSLPKADAEQSCPNELQQCYNSHATTGGPARRKDHEPLDFVGDGRCLDSECGGDSYQVYSNAATGSLQHITGLPDTNSTNHSSLRETLMTEDWRPSEDMVLMVIQLFGLSEPQVEMAILEFRDFWLRAKRPKANWDGRFRSSVPKSAYFLKKESLAHQSLQDSVVLQGMRG